MNKEQKDQLEEALRAKQDSMHLREIVKSWIDQGQERDIIYNELSDFMLMLREMGREEEEDLILEVLAFFDGWCRPGLEL